jgi:hypothetical protein
LHNNFVIFLINLIKETEEMKRMKVVRVTKDEFELDDGTIQPMVLKLDYVPTVEEFQALLDKNAEMLGLEMEDGEEAEKP